MPITIRVKKESDPEGSRDYVYRQDTVTIGREAANLLQLENPLVSRKHAKIEQRGKALYITDQKSRKGTLVNDERLVPEQPRLLQSGDKIRICDFVLEVLTPAAAPDRDTAQDIRREEAVRPPAEGPDRLVENVADQYAKAESPGKKEAMKLALVNLLNRLESSDTEGLASRLEALQKESGLLRSENERLRNQIAALDQPSRQKESDLLRVENERLRERVAVLEQAPRDGVKQGSLAPLPPAQGSQSVTRLHLTVATLLKSFLKLMMGRASFRSEFLGFTMMQDPDSMALHAYSPEKAEQFLVDPSVPEETAGTRLAGLGEEADAVILHVMGLLDGYRRSVDEGTRKLLQRSSPDLIEKELAETNFTIGTVQIPYRYLPGFFHWKLLALIRRRHRELAEEDRGILEKRFFRPGFIQGYEACVSSSKNEPPAHPSIKQKDRPL